MLTLVFFRRHLPSSAPPAASPPSAPSSPSPSSPSSPGSGPTSGGVDLSILCLGKKIVNMTELGITTYIAPSSSKSKAIAAEDECIFGTKGDDTILAGSGSGKGKRPYNRERHGLCMYVCMYVCIYMYMCVCLFCVQTPQTSSLALLETTLFAAVAAMTPSTAALDGKQHCSDDSHKNGCTANSCRGDSNQPLLSLLLLPTQQG